MKFISIKTSEYNLHHIILTSGNEEYPGCRLKTAAWKWYIQIRLPQVIRPHRKKVRAEFWNEETIKRLGRDWYWQITEREFGVSQSDTHVCFYFGLQSGDSSTEKSWGFFIPWLEWRHVRFSLFDLQGKHFWTQIDNGKEGWKDYEKQRKKQDECPSRTFLFKDFDGEQLAARTIINEREWRRGTKWFKWLSFFYSPKVVRCLDITFSGETGPRKGSWKGGTIGHGIDMLPGELHEGAFRRYCVGHNMTLLVDSNMEAVHA